jgi:hypothetical protein
VGCDLTTPAEVLNAVSLCAQTALQNPPCVIVVGSDGAGDTYECCDCGTGNGVLAIECGSIAPRDRNGRSVSGSGPCGFDPWIMDITVRRRVCVQSFEKGPGGVTTGAAVNPQVRTAAALANSAEGWLMLQRLLCCTQSEWKGCNAQVVYHKLLQPSGGCFGHLSVVKFELFPCCE